MITTAFIVEIIVIGFFTSIWIIIAIFRIAPIESSELLIVIDMFKPFSGLLFIITMIIFYQLGWLVNYISGFLANIFYEKRRRKTIFSEENLDYSDVRTTAYQYASGRFLVELTLDRNVVRLSRSGVFNFMLISISIFSFGNRFIIFGAVALFVGILCLAQYHDRFNSYYKRMIESYNTIVNIKNTHQ